MFKSIEYLRYDSKSNIYIYLLTDSDFEVEVGAAAVTPKALGWGALGGGSHAAAPFAVVGEYDRRKLPVGKNLLLVAKFYEKNDNYDFKDLINWQNKYIPLYLKEVKYPNYEEKWEQWKKERDEYLVML